MESLMKASPQMRGIDRRRTKRDEEVEDTRDTCSEGRGGGWRQMVAKAKHLRQR
jgi:hypothetical protein